MIYSPTVSFLKGNIDKPQLIRLIQHQLHAYIRRQLTWFKRDKQIQWFNVAKDSVFQEVAALLDKYLKARS